MWILFLLSFLLFFPSNPIHAREGVAPAFETAREKAMEETLLRFLEREPSVPPAIPAIPAIPAMKIQSDILTASAVRVAIGSSITIPGKQITRFMTTVPDKVSVKQTSPSSLGVTGQTLGDTLLLVWDQGERQSYKIQVVYKTELSQVTPLVKEAKKGKQAKPLQLRYDLNHNSFYRGNSASEMNRQTLSMTQRIEGRMETPYGDADYSTLLRKRKEDFDVSNYTFQFKNGHVQEIRNFDLTLFDTSVSGVRYTLPPTQIRGIQWSQRTEPFDYDLFGGRERLGSFGSLAPGFEKEQDSFLTGIGLHKQYEETFLSGIFVHGYGDDRNPKLKADAGGISFDYGKPSLWKGELGSDGRHYGLSLRNRLGSKTAPWKLETSYWNVEKDLLTIVGTPPNQGEEGIRFIPSYFISKNLQLDGTIEIYKNRLFPNPAEPDALNQRVQLGLSSYFWDFYNFRFIYSDTRLMGSLSPSELAAYSAYLSRSFKIRDRNLNTYLRYQFRDNVYRSSPANDFESHQFVTGGNLNVTQNLSLNLSEEWNFLDETTVNIQGRPRAFSAGLGYKLPIPRKVPLRGNYGLHYRNEENTDSPRSFLSGEDTLSHSLNLTYTLSKEVNIFLNGSLKHIRFENNNPRQAEGEIFMGMRSSYDTPWRWNPRASVVGMIFEDSNSNGYQDKEENGIEGIRVFSSDGKSAVSDDEGYYWLEGVSGKTAFIQLDISSLPPGYMTTGMTEREATISQGEIALVHFGILSTSQIRGFVYNDLNSNRSFDLSDAGIQNVTVWLDETKSIKTDSYGHFNFGRIDPGKHTLRVDVNSLPYTYLTDIPLKQEITLSLNESYELFFPLRTTRIIAGKVYRDTNQNGRYDQGEKGIGGVKVSIAGTTVVTDSKGSYLLENAPVGEIKVQVNEKTKTIQVHPEGTLAQDVDFAVR